MADIGGSGWEREVGQPLNLLSLARTAAGTAERVPGTALEVVALRAGTTTLERSCWLLVLEGELIIDLPFGDFRVLKTGDALQLEAGLTLGFEPVEDVVLCRLDIPNP